MTFKIFMFIFFELDYKEMPPLARVFKFLSIRNKVMKQKYMQAMNK